MANVEPLLPGVGKPVSMSDTSPIVANINNIHISPASQFCYACMYSHACILHQRLQESYYLDIGYTKIGIFACCRYLSKRARSLPSETIRHCAKSYLSTSIYSVSHDVYHNKPDHVGKKFGKKSYSQAMSA